MKDRLILTTEGVKKMSDVTPGYYVYSYETGEPLMITGVEVITIDQIVEVWIKDGRIQRMTPEEFMVLAGYQKIPFKEIQFDPNRPKITRPPDPYTAGFIFYGTDMSEDRLSVPTSSFMYMTAPIRKYHIGVGEIKGDRTYLKWEIDGKDLTWNNFFIGHYFDRSSKYKIIPYAYQYGLHQDRMQFIQGIFDAGGLHDGMSEYMVAVKHKDLALLQAFQRILWSLNIPCSIIDYDDGKGYILKADTSHEISANFFYNEDFIRNYLTKDDLNSAPNDSVFPDMVRFNSLDHSQVLMIPKLAETGKLYVDIDYLPIASL